jgi:uncharacterized protein
MPQLLTYPGVYIEEVSSGVRSISGVSTSTTAFIGWAPKGPTTRALRVFSFAEYERKYGGLHPKSWLGYSVKHYFDNGGQEAWILRVAGADATVEETTLGDLQIKANSPGQWSEFYAVQTKKLASDQTRFTLTVLELQRDASGRPDPTKTSVAESFVNLSMNKDDSRYVVEIVKDIERGSQLIEVDAADDATDPGDSDTITQLPAGDETPLEDSNSNEFIAAVDNVAKEDGVLDQVRLFNLLCVPGCTDRQALSRLLSFCRYRRAFLIADSPSDAKLSDFQSGTELSGETRNGAIYFPWIKASDPLAENTIQDFPPCGFMAGIFARTDASRGVWKAPAGIDAALTGVHSPKDDMTDKQNGSINIRAVNCIRKFPIYGTVVWGARTLDGDEERGSEWKYIPVRRTALFIEESLYRGTQWAVFEPNDEPLWAQLRLNIGAFMHDLFRQGAFQGRTPREAYFVKCDKETTTQSDINRGIVNAIVGFAPLKPAEFVVIKITQIAGQIEA